MNADQKKRATELLANWRTEGQKVWDADRMAALLQELIDVPEVEPALVVEVEPDYWSRGHYYEGSKPHISPLKVWKLPVGTKLYTAPPAPSVPDGWRSAIAKEFPLYDEDEIDEDKHCCEWVMLQERKRLHKILAAAPTPAEAQADVARLDWLVASDWYIGPEYGADEAGGIVGYDNKNIDGLRAAIDAAMSEKGQQA